MQNLGLLPKFNYQAAISGLLQKTKLTQTQIAESIGVSQGRISQILNGIDSDTVRYENRVRLHQLCMQHGVKVENEIEHA